MIEAMYCGRTEPHEDHEWDASVEWDGPVGKRLCPGVYPDPQTAADVAAGLAGPPDVPDWQDLGPVDLFRDEDNPHGGPAEVYDPKALSSPDGGPAGTTGGPTSAPGTPGAGPDAQHGALDAAALEAAELAALKARCEQANQECAELARDTARKLGQPLIAMEVFELRTRIEVLSDAAFGKDSADQYGYELAVAAAFKANVAQLMKQAAPVIEEYQAAQRRAMLLDGVNASVPRPPR